MATDIRQTSEYAKYLKTLGWEVERIAEINYFIKRIPIIGSVLKIQRPSEIRIDTINYLAKKYRAFQIIIEPKDDLQAQFLTSTHYKLSKSPYLPSKTLLIDLRNPKNQIVGSMKKDAISAIQKSERSGIEVREATTAPDLENFYIAWKSSVSIKRYVPPFKQLLSLRKSFNLNPALFLTSHNISGGVIGGAIFTRSLHDIAYYWQGFTNNEGRSTLSQYSLVWKGILWAKSHGCKYFDFEGIYDSRFPNKQWLGFTHFKRSFGGSEISYPGTYIKFLLPF